MLAAFYVQMAKQRGARVIATVSSRRKADHALFGVPTTRSITAMNP
jgi:NADPH:quinone reductase-like Zn-dependent oxidoreductase